MTSVQELAKHSVWTTDQRNGRRVYQEGETTLGANHAIGTDCFTTVSTQHFMTIVNRKVTVGVKTFLANIMIVGKGTSRFGTAGKFPSCQYNQLTT